MLQNQRASLFKIFQRLSTWAIRFKLITVVYKAIYNVIPRPLQLQL